MSNRTSESREDVMSAPSLFTLLCEKTAADYKSKWDKSCPKPPIGGFILTTLLAGVFWVFRRNDISQIFFLLTMLQIGWAILSAMIRVYSAVARKQEMIMAGTFPPECAGIVMNRLRWWSLLIVPHHWARHSRIHERKYRLEKRIKEIEDRYLELEEEQEEKKEKLEGIPNTEHMSLAAKINSMAERSSHEERIGEIEEEMPRLIEEVTLYRALLYKILEVTSKLDRIDELASFTTHEASDLTTLAQTITMAQEERRILVEQVDLIDPDYFLQLVQV